MVAPVKIKLASRTYDGTLPILRGQIGIEGFQFEITETEDVPGMFAGHVQRTIRRFRNVPGRAHLLHLPRQGGFCRDPDFSIAHVSPRLHFLPQVLRRPSA
jgi:hypothetical protein